MELVVVGPLDPDQAWDGGSAQLHERYQPGEALPATLLGAYGGAYRHEDGRWRLARDPLGINKVFWSVIDDELMVAARPRRLVERGVRFEDIRSLPRGAVVDSRPGAGPLDVSAVTVPEVSPVALSDVAGVAPAIRERLVGYLSALQRSHADDQVFVCLSGGIDSTAIGVLARDHFPDVVFVSFDLVRPDGSSSEDRLVARRIADDLGAPLLEVDVSIDELLERLDEVLIEGVDWRDFNVHAALVNSALAHGIRAQADRARVPIILTGDLANEFVADYVQEDVRGTVSYQLPAVPIGSLRRLLVAGLDTSHREVGVFGAAGLVLVQPYAVAAGEYLSLPDAFLEVPDRKEHLANDITGGRMPRYVLDRPKVRAQVGGADGGVLGAFLDRGIDQAALKMRFAELHDTAPTKLDRFIRGGLYRSATPPLDGTTSEASSEVHDAA